MDGYWELIAPRVDESESEGESGPDWLRDGEDDNLGPDWAEEDDGDGPDDWED